MVDFWRRKMTLRVRIVLPSILKRTKRQKYYYGRFHSSWPYLLTTELSYLQKNNFGHTTCVVAIKYSMSSSMSSLVSLDSIRRSSKMLSIYWCTNLIVSVSKVVEIPGTGLRRLIKLWGPILRVTWPALGSDDLEPWPIRGEYSNFAGAYLFFCL